MAQLVEKLAAFVDADRVQSWQPGVCDCCMFLAAWAIWLGHDDPAAHLRGTYNSENGFRAIIGGAGGVVPLVSACVANISGRKVDVPNLGAIAVIGSSAKIEKQWGAIFDGRRWLVRAQTGILTISATPLAVWEIEHA